ncbi:MAG: radical SAM protein [Deltaproteobacteria bacterium]|nr:radical SAM protein [Deltaproteobacteria bacterium]
MTVEPCPDHVVLEVTSRCNLRCKGCAFHGPEAFVSRPTGTMPETTWRKAIKEIGEWGHPLTLAANGGGEPLLHPHFREILLYARLFPQLRLGFLTNGMLMDAEWADFLVDIGVDWVAVSIDGISPYTHRQVRPGSDLDLIEENLIRLLDRKARTRNGRPDILLNMVLYDEVADQKEAFLKKWIQRVDRVMISYYRNPPSSKRWPFTPSGRRPCSLLWSQMVIAWDGRLALCCEDFNLDYPLGSVQDKGPLLDIWNGPRLASVRTLHEQGRFEAHPLCRECDTWADSIVEERVDATNRYRTWFKASQVEYALLNAAEDGLKHAETAGT